MRRKNTLLAFLRGKSVMKKAAYWTQRTHLFRSDEYICSVCKASCKRPYKVCPKCGSQMRKSMYDPSWVDEAEMSAVLMDDDW